MWGEKAQNVHVTVLAFTGKQIFLSSFLQLVVGWKNDPQKEQKRILTALLECRLVWLQVN